MSGVRQARSPSLHRDKKLSFSCLVLTRRSVNSGTMDLVLVALHLVRADQHFNIVSTVVQEGKMVKRQVKVERLTERGIRGNGKAW